MPEQSKKLYVVAAPSGVGKTSLVNALLAECDDLYLSISYTTRLKRQGEIDGSDYFFVDQKKFQQMIADNDFLEYARVYGNYYGTSFAWVTDKLNTGHHVILEIDWQGAQQIRQRFPDAVMIFLLPPSKAMLRERLYKRQQDDEASINTRMEGVATEVSHCYEFDYILVNDDFDRTLQQLKAIVNGVQLPKSDADIEILVNTLTGTK
ncbi:MAG: guanylate kinase [Pseudomonadota bacterium]